MENYEVISIREFARRVGASDGQIRKKMKPGQLLSESFQISEVTGWPELLYEKALAVYQTVYPVTPIIGQKTAVGEIPAGASVHQIKTRAGIAKKKGLSVTFEGEEAGKVSTTGQAVAPVPVSQKKIAKQIPAEHGDGEPPTGKMQAATMQVFELELRQKSAQSQLTEIKLQEALGNLVPIAEVRKALFNFGAEIRDSISGIPDRIVDNVRAVDTRQEALIIMNVAINQALQALTDISTRKLTKNEGR